MSCKTHAYLKIGHSINQQKYVDWKYVFLSPYCIQKPSVYLGNEQRVGYRFWTRSLPVFTDYYRQYYDPISRRKHISRLLRLTPLALAIWFMDDGAQNRRSLYLNTQQFSIEDQTFLLYCLKRQFGILGSLNKDKSYWRIRLFQPSAQYMKRLIEPLMPSCMKYKLPL